MDDNYLRKNMKSSKCLGLITARGGSKGVVNKNIRELNGVPLIAYTINVAKKCQHIDRLIVSTDSEAIKKVSLEFGAEVPFLRPKNISKDKSTDLQCFSHCLNFLKKKENYTPDLIVHLRPTYPLREKNLIDNCIKELLKKKDFIH